MTELNHNEIISKSRNERVGTAFTLRECISKIVYIILKTEYRSYKYPLYSVLLATPI